MPRAVLCAAILFAAALSGPAFAEDRYRVSIDLVHDGEVFAKSRLLLPPGSETHVDVPENGLSLVLVANDFGDGRIRLSTRVVSAYGSMQPTMVLVSGKASTIANDAIEMRVTATRVGS